MREWRFPDLPRCTLSIAVVTPSPCVLVPVWWQLLIAAGVKAERHLSMSRFIFLFSPLLVRSSMAQQFPKRSGCWVGFMGLMWPITLSPWQSKALLPGGVAWCFRRSACTLTLSSSFSPFHFLSPVRVPFGLGECSDLRTKLYFLSHQIQLIRRTKLYMDEMNLLNLINLSLAHICCSTTLSIMD
jgi:hypothetical protein